MSDPCPRCGTPLVGCVKAQEFMQVRHWLCPSCRYDTRAIGRERMITADDLEWADMTEILSVLQGTDSVSFVSR